MMIAKLINLWPHATRQACLLATPQRYATLLLCAASASHSAVVACALTGTSQCADGCLLRLQAEMTADNHTAGSGILQRLEDVRRETLEVLMDMAARE